VERAGRPEAARYIDPGHVVDEKGVRWLFLSGGDRIQLAPDGLSTVGQPEHVYNPWRYPDDWDVEGFSPEGPKVMKRGEYYYLVTAVGGTAGPPTGHMVIVARAKSLAGPWEDDPKNPVVRTTNNSEKWWSRGHATLVEGPAGDWWTVYHGYENGFYTLGRQTLLAPVTWTKDGWFEVGGGDLSKPLAKPQGGKAVPHGMALSDDFSTDKYGVQWNFFDPKPGERDRIKREGGVLTLKGAGEAPSDRRAADLRQRRPGLRDRVRDRDRSRHPRRPDPVLRPPALLRPGLRREELRHPPVRHRAGPARPIRTARRC
jgi:xylan 1,4-beta-xylosidase